MEPPGTNKHGGIMTEPEGAPKDVGRLSGGAIASLAGLAALLIFIFQNPDDVEFRFLVLRFTWPLWLYTIITALFGALVWRGIGMLRRHRRRVERRHDR